MVHGIFRLLALLLCTLPLSAFTIVMNPDPSEEKAANLTDAERMRIFVEDKWDETFAPFFTEQSHPFTDVASALADGLETAGERYGLRPEGEANPWNFVVSGEGTIIDANTESRAATATIDVNGDGQGDFTLQLGPVIKGTTLRDAATFLTFSDFRDQIEYAKLARALNTRVYEDLVDRLPMDALQGKKISFRGALTARSPGSDLLITPIDVGISE